MGNIKEKIRNSYNKAFAGITDVNASNDLRKIQDTNKKEIPDIKMEPKEATDSGSAGVFVPPMSGEMEEKWSEKYKKSIDCNNPKGFSQRAHCQGRKKKLREAIVESIRTQAAQLKDIARKYSKEVEGESEKQKIEKMISVLKKQLRKGIDIESKEYDMSINKIVQIVIDHLKKNPYHYSESEKPKKTETKEATGSASSGSYETPAFGAKSMSPKHWRGRAKTQIPGGAFVQVKKKCKTFPYCNQGDINALEISRNPVVKKKKKKLAEQYGVS
ncbi:hypothetical protein EBU94_05065, partial [bacterium]|nr:hypothetical protein [bacterium]